MSYKKKNKNNFPEYFELDTNNKNGRAKVEHYMSCNNKHCIKNSTSYPWATNSCRTFDICRDCLDYIESIQIQNEKLRKHILKWKDYDQLKERNAQLTDHFNICETCKELDAETYGSEIYNTNCRQ